MNSENRSPITRSVIRRITLTLAAFAGVVAFATPAKAETTPPPNFFPIGVWLQPSYMFDTWKSRGVNTIVDCYSGWDLNQWNSAAMADGLYMIRQPLAGSAINSDVNNKYLIAWSHDDEPDVSGVTPATLTTNFAAWQKVDPNRPVFVNFSGANVLNDTGAKNQARFQSFMTSANWVGNDIYPVTGYNRPDWLDYSKTVTDRKTPGMVIDQLRAWSGGKAQYAFIETSNQNLSWMPAGTRGVTASEFRGEVWDAIVHGARGVFYFPQSFNGFSQDSTPASVVSEMTKQDALISSLGGVLNSGSVSDPQRFRLTSPTLEGAWREYKGQEYYFVLNMSSITVTSTMSLPGLTDGELVDVYGESRRLTALGTSLTDTFAPYQLHVYEPEANTTPTITGPGAAVPEPSGLGALGVIAAMGLARRRRAGK